MEILRETGAVQWFETTRIWPLSREVEFDSGWLVPLTVEEVLCPFAHLGHDVVFLWDRQTGVAVATSIYAACASVLTVYDKVSYCALRMAEVYGHSADVDESDGSGKSVDIDHQQVAVDEVVIVESGLIVTENCVVVDGSGKSAEDNDGDEVVEYVAAGVSAGEQGFDRLAFSVMEYAAVVSQLSSVHCGGAVHAPDGLVSSGVEWLARSQVVDGMHLSLGMVKLDGSVCETAGVVLSLDVAAVRVYWPTSVGSEVFSCYDTGGLDRVVLPIVFGLNYAAVFVLAVGAVDGNLPVLDFSVNALLGSEMCQLGLTVVSGLCYMAAVPKAMRLKAVNDLGWFPIYDQLIDWLDNRVGSVLGDYRFVGSQRVCHMESSLAMGGNGLGVQPLATTLVGGSEFGVATSGVVRSDSRDYGLVAFVELKRGRRERLNVAVANEPICVGMSKELESRSFDTVDNGRWMAIYNKNADVALGIVPLGGRFAATVMHAVRSHMTSDGKVYAFPVKRLGSKSQFRPVRVWDPFGALIGYAVASNWSYRLLETYSVMQ